MSKKHHGGPAPIPARNRPAAFPTDNRNAPPADEGARRVVQEFLRPTVRPTALYCFNNTLAQLVVEAFRRQGVQVPRDVSVMGAGGEDVPGLTCLQVDWYQMGKGAIQILIRAPSAPRRRTLERELCPHTLRLGQTAAAPPPVS